MNVDVDSLPLQAKWDEFSNSYCDLLRLNKDLESFVNVAVMGDSSIIVDANYSVIESTLNEAIFWTPNFFDSRKFEDESLRSAIIRERVAFIKYVAHYQRVYFGSSIQQFSDSGCRYIYIAHTFGWYAYGHLFDSIQRLFPLRGSFKKGRDKFVVSSFNRVYDFLEHLSAAVGFEVQNDDVVEIKRENIYKFSNLIVPYSPAIITNFTRDSYSWLINAYYQRFVTRADYSGRYKLYLSRNHITPGSRSVNNEDLLIAQLIEQGFTVLYGNENLSEIVNYFSDAIMVVGPHGSLFANTIFCTKNCSIIEYCPDNRVDYSFKNKYKAAVKYFHKLMPADAKFNINLSIDRILSDVNNLE